MARYISVSVDEAGGVSLGGVISPNSFGISGSIFPQYETFILSDLLHTDDGWPTRAMHEFEMVILNVFEIINGRAELTYKIDRNFLVLENKTNSSKIILSYGN